MRGGAGDDVVEGLGGRDELYGEDGNDELRARDGEIDLVDCGTALDTVVADVADDVSSTCETRVNPPGPDPTPAPPSPVAPVAVPDLVRPSVKLTGVTRRVRRSRLLRRGLRLTLAPGEPVSVEVTLRRPGGRRLVARRVSVSGGSRRLRLRIPSARRTQVPRRGRRLTLVVRAEDRAGNVTVLRRTLRLR